LQTQQGVQRYLQVYCKQKKAQKKIALITVSNKLLKQAFAIAKLGYPDNSNFVSILIIK